MKSLVTTFLRGLSVVLPIALTIWFVVWLATGTEDLLRSVFLWFLPPELYLPGLGVALGIAVIFAAGLLAQIFFLRQFWNWMESLLERIPLVKTVYNAIRDFLDFFSSTGIEKQAAKVVTIDMGNEVNLIGLITDNNPEFPIGTSTDLIAVYLPMSYNVGGYTVLVPRTRVHDSNMTVEAAMRYAMTAGIRKQQ